MGTPEYPSMMRLRKIWAEDSFSVLKREHCISKIRKRGILAATEECLLAAMALNSFAISQFIILLEPLLVSAVFLLLSTGPLLYLILTRVPEESVMTQSVKQQPKLSIL